MMNRLIAGLVLALVLAAGATAKPLVVILADAEGTVATDLFSPYAILAASGAVEVTVASATTEPVRLTPGEAWLMPQVTLAQLEHERPDVVIVPALSVVDDADRSAWLREQVNDGVRIMSICNGAKVLAAAGLLDGRDATVHWYSHDDLEEQYPEVSWQRDQRWVEDGPIITTAGISAAEPATLALLGQLAGEKVMQETARRLQLPLPDQRHEGDDYRLTLRGAGLVVVNRLAFWQHEDVALPLAPGFDELAFGVALDAWSRTYRSTAWAVAAPGVTSRYGLQVRPSKVLPARFDREVQLAQAHTVQATFEEIRDAYGERTARFVALQFEHPYGAVSAW